MRYLITLFLVFGLFSFCYAGRVCVEKSTGKLIEYQSNATEGTLIKNALNQGYKQSDIEEKEINPQEWQAIINKQIIEPAKEKEKQKEEARKQKENSIKQKLNLSDKEFTDLKEALDK